jgi:hypothetical protein
MIIYKKNIFSFSCDQDVRFSSEIPRGHALGNAMTFTTSLTRYLNHHQLALTVYAFIVSFITYASMYAFRKPFTVGHYSNVPIGRINFKVLAIIAQMIGYALSKFSGIIFISGLTRTRRGLWICGFVSIAELALVGFAVAPLVYKLFFMFINGLPLGLIWGLVFSFIEGRRTSEFLTTGMCISFIFSSGAAKAAGKTILNLGVPDFWMPAVTGALFLPFLFAGAYLLELLPPPNEEDVRTRTERVPMTARDRAKLLRDFRPGITSMVLFYMLLNAARDFRDNFAPELWSAFGYHTAPALFAASEIVVGLVVLIPIICFMFIKSNVTSLVSYHILIIAGMVGTGAVAALYNAGAANGFAFMVLSGIGVHLAYIPFSNIIFELILATFRYKANSGFLMYTCDSLGYLTSLVVVIVRDFGTPHLNWDHFYVKVNYALAGSGLVFMGFSLMYFIWRYETWRMIIFEDSEPPLLGADEEEEKEAMNSL